MGFIFKAWTSLTIFLQLFISFANGTCFYHSPAFPPPDYSKPWPELLDAFTQIEASVSTLVESDPSFNTSSYSIEVTSSQSTLWSTFHTALVKDPERPGADEVNGDSVYRIASITKVFTVLGILRQHEAGNLSLEDSVEKYIPGLEGTISWKDITLRSLASQLSGIPRDWAQGDLFVGLPDPTSLGLPPIDPSFSDQLPQCDSYGDYTVPCTEEDLLENLSKRRQLFAPNQKSTYSNIAFELLGMVLANVTGMAYEEYIESEIIAPTAIGDKVHSSSSFTKPPDSVAVLPKGESWYWDVDEGVQNPTGGLYFSSSAMSQFLRYVLQHYNNNDGDGKVSRAMNWLQPASFTPGMSSFYGTPWETFRTNRILDPYLDAEERDRTVTFFTKGGGLPGYSTIIALVPEYGLGLTIFTAGKATLLKELLERVTVPLIQAADKVSQRSTRENYAGRYAAATASPGSQQKQTLNSSLTLKYTARHGLEITHWISNGTGMIPVIQTQFFHDEERPGGFHLQLIPTFLYRDEVRRKGELWRIVLTEDRPPTERDGGSKKNKSKVWDDFCISDVDTMMYAGKPLNEVVFWDGGDNESNGIRTVELTAFRVSMTLSDEGVRDEGTPLAVVVQQDL